MIYKHIIYRDMIDNQVARVLPGILKANRIQVKGCGDEVCDRFQRDPDR